MSFLCRIILNDLLRKIVIVCSSKQSWLRLWAAVLHSFLFEVYRLFPVCSVNVRLVYEVMTSWACPVSLFIALSSSLTIISSTTSTTRSRLLQLYLSHSQLLTEKSLLYVSTQKEELRQNEWLFIDVDLNLIWLSTNKCLPSYCVWIEKLGRICLNLLTNC